MDLSIRIDTDEDDHMDTKRQEFEFLLDALSNFIDERRKHKKQNWFGFFELVRRYFREDREYPRLLHADVKFSHGMQRSLHQVVESRDISAGHLENFSVALAAHKSALSERRKILTFISPMFVALISLATIVYKFTENQSINSIKSVAHEFAKNPPLDSIEFIALLAATMVALALAERAQNQSWALIYDEFELLVKHEIERKGENGS